VTDPQGIAWEHFHTLADIPTFGGGPEAKACCPADARNKAAAASPASAPACC
jgi:hypothetical protein